MGDEKEGGRREGGWTRRVNDEKEGGQGGGAMWTRRSKVDKEEEQGGRRGGWTTRRVDDEEGGRQGGARWTRRRVDEEEEGRGWKGEEGGRGKRVDDTRRRVGGEGRRRNEEKEDGRSEAEEHNKTKANISSLTIFRMVFIKYINEGEAMDNPWSDVPQLSIIQSCIGRKYLTKTSLSLSLPKLCYNEI